MCSDHKSPLKHYCRTHASLLCDTCVVSSHRDHVTVVIALEDAAGIARGELRTVIDQLDVEEAELDERVKRASAAVASVEQARTAGIEAVQRAEEEVVAAVQQAVRLRVDELVSEINGRAHEATIALTAQRQRDDVALAFARTARTARPAEDRDNVAVVRALAAVRASAAKVHAARYTPDIMVSASLAEQPMFEVRVAAPVVASVAGEAAGLVNAVVAVCLTKDRMGNAFAPFQFDQAYTTRDVVLLPEDPLRFATKSGNWWVALGVHGMALQDGSGVVGVVEATVVQSKRFQYMSIGLATHGIDLAPGYGTLFQPGCIAWCDGCIDSRLAGFTGGGTKVPFNEGDRIGLVVDCRGPSRLGLLVNGAVRAWLPLPNSGEMIYPAVCVLTGELLMFKDPEVPQCGELPMLR